MAVDLLVAPLLRVELFQGLKPLQLTEIARRAERIVFRPGDGITKAGEDADAAYLIVSGSAEWLPAETDAADAAGPVEIGSLIGEMGMLIEHVYGATIKATGQVRCMKLNRVTMHELMLEDPSLARHLTEKITSRLGQVSEDLRAIDDEFAAVIPEFCVETSAVEPSLNRH